jgi:glutamate--cysteine ligase
VPREGLTATIQGRSLRDVGRDVLAIARDGMNARGLEEARFLDPLDAILATGETQADRWLQRFDNIWHGDGRMMLREAAI